MSESVSAHPGAGAPSVPGHVQAAVPRSLSQGRSEWLDALRGFALLGIVLYNIEVFAGIPFRGLMPDLQPFGAGLDEEIEFIARLLVQGKFYSLFSFLFGLGIALQLRWLPVGAVRRRLGWLLVIGLAHALLVWFGDILTVYAVLGFALLAFRHLSTRTLLLWAIAFLAAPVPLYLGFMALGMQDPLAGTPSPPGQSLVAQAVRALRFGSYIDVVQAQTMMYPGGWLRRAVQFSLPRIFGMFLLGMWAARLGFPRIGEVQQRLLRAWLWCAVLIGLPCAVALAMLGGNQAMFPVRPVGLLANTLATVSMPLLCLGYVAVFGLYWRKARPRSLLVAAGRAPLSHYLGQSIVCVALFYGHGLGLFGRLGDAPALLIAMVVFVLLAWAGRAWLSRFGQGPLESLWRRLSLRPPHSIRARVETARMKATPR